MFASYVPRNAFSVGHDPSYDVIGQMLGGQGLQILRGDVKKMGGMLWKNGDIRPVNKKKYSRKTAGGLHQPPVPARAQGFEK